MNVTEYAGEIVAELGRTLSQVDAGAGEGLAGAIMDAKKILVAGVGRSGFSAKAFAMRLMHMGFDVYVVGETVTPNLEREDLLLVVSGSGETGSLVVMSRKARELGAKLATVTVRPEGTVGQMADLVIQIPAITPKVKGDGSLRTIQPMGSLFEQSVLLFLDAVILRLMELRGDSSDTMYTRHANLE